VPGTHRLLGTAGCGNPSGTEEETESKRGHDGSSRASARSIEGKRPGELLSLLLHRQPDELQL